MKRSLTLTVLLFLSVLLAGTAFAYKTKRIHKYTGSCGYSLSPGNTDTILTIQSLYFAQSLIGTPVS